MFLRSDLRLRGSINLVLGELLNNSFKYSLSLVEILAEPLKTNMTNILDHINTYANKLIVQNSKILKITTLAAWLNTDHIQQLQQLLKTIKANQAQVGGLLKLCDLPTDPKNSLQILQKAEALQAQTRSAVEFYTYVGHSLKNGLPIFRETNSQLKLVKIPQYSISVLEDLVNLLKNWQFFLEIVVIELFKLTDRSSPNIKFTPAPLECENKDPNYKNNEKKDNWAEFGSINKNLKK